MSFDPRAIKAPEAVDGQTLSPEQKKKYKEGEVVELADGTEIQLSTIDKRGIRSNRNGLILSVVLDGGLSYLLMTGVQRILGKKTKEEESYSQGYIDGLKEIKKQVEHKMSLNPKNKDAAYDLDMVKQELAKIASANAATQGLDRRFYTGSISETKSAEELKGFDKKRGDGEYKRKL